MNPARTSAPAPASPVAQRRQAMALLAKADASELSSGLAAIPDQPAATLVRPVETGLVMLRGRIGGDGAPFNLGEATVTRAAVQLASGEIGFSCALGRDTEKARLAAICDALWQTDRYRAAVEEHVLARIRARCDARRAERRARTAATRVEFFTMVRGED